MRNLLVPLLLISFVDATAAQTKHPPPEATDIIVIKKSWHKSWYRPGWDRFFEPTYRGPAADGGELGSPNRATRGAPIDRGRAAPSREGFTYEATIKNTGKKTVKAVGWDYVFTDPQDKQANHHRFYHRTRIEPGKQTSLSKFAIQPPTRTVPANSDDKKIVEEVVINYVEYRDGSIWRKQ